jgi:3-phenylpropionate/cinnamic acid dioxygenase small subunit
MTTTDDVQAKMLLQYQLEHFYYEEAAMLDERRFEEWVDLFTDDTHYWMPIRRTRTLNELDKEFSAPGGMAYFDDDKAMLETRVRKLGTGYAWAEDPPSRTRHNVNNVRVVEDRGDELVVETNFHLYRTRLNSEEDTWIGLRRDTLRRVDGSFKIADRKIFIDQTIILSRNLSNFF